MGSSSVEAHSTSGHYCQEACLTTSVLLLADLLTCDFSPQNDQHALLESCTLALLELLPSMECLSPRQAIQEMKAEREGETMIL